MLILGMVRLARVVVKDRDGDGRVEDVGTNAG